MSGASFQAEKPRVWADKKFLARPRPPSRDVAIHPDGKRFAYIEVNSPNPGIQVKVNGKAYLREVEPRLLLVEFLREDLELRRQKLWM